MTWEEEAKAFLQSFITNGTIFNGNLIGIDDFSQTAIAVVVMSDGGTPIKAIEKYYYIKKINTTINFYEMDRLPSRF